MSTPESQFDFSSVAQPAPPPAYDFSSIARPSPRATRPTRAPSPSAPAPSDWSLATGAPKVKAWYKQTFGAELPVSSFGQDDYHNSIGLDHRNAFDVPLSLSSKEGQALIGYLRDSGIPFRPITRADIARGVKASGEHIHVGPESHGLGSRPVYDFSSVASAPSQFDFSSIAQPAPDDDGEPERIDATVDRVTGERMVKPEEVTGASSLAASTRAQPAAAAPDVMTMEGRAERDARHTLERTPGEGVEVAVPLSEDDPSKVSGDELMRRGIRQWVASKGIPAGYVEDWMKRNAPTGYSLHDPKTGAVLQTALDAITPDSDVQGQSAVRVALDAPHLAKLQDDYKLDQLRSVPGMEDAKSLGEASPLLRDLTVDVDETSPGEKFLAGATPVAHAALRATDLGTRPLQALEAGFWAKVRGANDLTAVKTAYQQFFGDDPELGKNVIAEALRNSDRLRAINPKLPSFLGELANIVLEPSNVVLIGGTALGAKLLRGSAAAARAGEAARGLGLLGRGFVEARPLGLGDAALGSAASDAGEPLHVLLRGTDGTNYLAHTGTGDVINLETGELVYEGGKPVAESGAVNSAELPGVGRPPLTEGEIAQKAREVGMPVEEVRQEALRQGYRVAPGDAPPEQPLHEYLEELTGRPAPELQPVPQPPPSLGSRVVNISSDIINAPKSIKSSLALHGPFRQGVFQAAAHPTFLQDAITQQVKAFASEDAYRAFAQSLTEKPWYQPMQDAGLFLPSTYDVEMGGRAPAWMREERFASAAAEKIPGVRASSRAYVGAMDSIRSQAVEHYLTTLYGPEMDLSKADPETLKALAEFVNLSTGRGTVPILDRFASGRQAVAAANNLLWSPRAMASRFNLVSPYRLVMNAANPATRPVAALQAADSMRTALSVGATLSLLALVPGVKVGLNPFKSGWGMVRVGNTEYDILDGVPSTVKAAAQVGQLLYRHAEGKSPARGRSVYGLTSDFPHRRLSPSAQVAAEALTGKNAMGDKVSGSQMASDLLTPFTLEEMYKAWIDAGGSSVGDTLQGKEFKTGFKGAAKGLPSAVGVPTRTYKEQNQGGPREEIRRAVEGADLEAEPTFREFPDGMSQLNVPRSSMPQIKSEHRGAMVQFLKGRGITHTQELVAPTTLKPSQAEYSPEKIARARAFEGPNRSLLVSADGHVADGHHQWLAALADSPREPYPAIRLNAPIQQLLLEMARFPSSGVDEASAGR